MKYERIQGLKGQPEGRLGEAKLQCGRPHRARFLVGRVSPIDKLIVGIVAEGIHKTIRRIELATIGIERGFHPLDMSIENGDVGPNQAPTRGGVPVPSLFGGWMVHRHVRFTIAS